MSRSGIQTALLIAVSVYFLTGCVTETIRKVGPGSLNVGKRFDVTTDTEWSVWELSNAPPPMGPLFYRNRWPIRSWPQEIQEQSQIWTRKGYILQELGFISGIKTDQEIHEGLEDSRYRADMTAAEVATLVSKLLYFGRRDGFVLPTISHVPINGKEAIHFIAQSAQDAGFQHGLEYKTTVYAFPDKDRLDFVYFTAPAMLYYDKYWPEAERVIRSIRFK